MTTCPNCGRLISDNDKICPKCHFDLQKYRDTFFTDQYQKTNYENKKTGESIVNRKLYRQQFYPEKQNPIVKKMLQWMHNNSMIVFLLGIALLVIMSFSRSIGWICFFSLLIWLYLVCVKAKKVERYTVDERLTEKVNQICSNMFNSVEESSQRVHSKSKTHDRDEHLARKHFSYVQLLVLLMAVINLVVIFTGSGASFSDVTYTGKMSLTRVTFRLVGHLFSSSATQLSGVLLCFLWALIVIWPVIIIYTTLKDGNNHRLIAFTLSLVESVFLIYLIFKLPTLTLTKGGILKNISNEILLYAVSIGASTYFLVLSSIMTTVLTGYNLFKEKKRRH